MSEAAAIVPDVPLPACAFWGVREISAFTGLSESTVRKEVVCKPWFPRPYDITETGRYQWSIHEVKESIESKRLTLPAGRKKRDA